ncbi:heterokaryon incompatibility protein Het-C-domain-containing protein [Aspergillus pseudoustus]|uniref:Heterokaryon incompatibility protein Het-C-domain-containing protein n=1 Tax=Aspergillus pseudoustus TaxID=1810923 RepID=A0ABR4IDQ3_9EURO
MGPSYSNLPVLLFFLFCLSSKVHAFGAGNIASLSKIEGQNWRHGDIEDVLLTLALARVAGGRKFSKLDVQRVYFGNWLRDYSQAVDVGTLKYVSAEAIRILLWVLGFMSFGYGTKEFEVTTERLGCYQPTEHIDNPLGYAEGEDARTYDRRLRGPVDEELELGIDPRTGLKNYIANEHVGIATSAGLVRQVFTRSIQLGRRYASSRNQEDLHEALRLLGTGLHCLEDYAAHSNYVELALIQLGETDIFPHVGRSTQVEIEGLREPVYPLITGTFGGVDFFHSVLGEISDKATQSEIQSLEGVINQSQGDSPSDSFLQDLLSKIPDGLIGSSDEKVGRMDELKAESEHQKNQNVSPREPEEWANYLDDVQKQIYPVLEWHDELLKSINEAIEKIPLLPELIEQVQEQITVAVFSILAPYILPILQQVKLELQTGSSEVIQTSREQQHIVFNDDYCTNPTHSMLSKDHFSNVLNEPAGRIASQVVKWTVPQLMELWDNEDADIDATLDRIVSGVFHHPALYEYGRGAESEIRSLMFGTVQQWWSDKSRSEIDYLREQLSRDGVREGKNHKEGVQDCGHGCGKPFALHKGGASSTQGRKSNVSGIEKIAANAAGGGALGGLVGGLVSGVGSMLLNESGAQPQRTEEREYSGYTQETRAPQYGQHYEQHYEQRQYTTRRNDDSDEEDRGSHRREHRHSHSGARKHHSRERNHSPKEDSEDSEQEKGKRRHRKHRSRERSHERNSDSEDERERRGYKYSQQEDRYEDGGRRYVQETSQESYRPERGEYRSEYTQSTYESGNHSSYRHEQQEYHQDNSSTQEYSSGYGQSQGGYGGEYRPREEYSQGGYSGHSQDYSEDHSQVEYRSRNEYGGSQEGYGQNYGGGYSQRGYGQRDDERRGYGY